ncbi:ABC transporter permease [Myxococcota bacterium]|nr:ABC transporter permease [Myxococcota bacterium]MBU1382865.1 ABC transporter permease [Myxococcota bacterium]MBU1496656.1 ABC transporter permease [Myxococcota bacterium]
MFSFRLLKLVQKNVKRNSKQLALASIGIIIGLWAFSLFLSFGLGVTNVVEGEIFPWDKIEVIPPATNLEMTRANAARTQQTGCEEDDFYINDKPNGTLDKESASLFKKLRFIDDSVVDMLKKRQEVKTAYPKMQLTFPAIAEGGMDELHLSHPIRTEIFADGLEPKNLIQCNELETKEDMEKPRELRRCDVMFPFKFKDYSDDNKELDFCEKDSDCPKAIFCEANSPSRIWIFPLEKETGDSRKAENQYHQCYHAVPVVISTYLLELWNGSVAPAHGYPKISKSTLGTFLGLSFDVHLGRSMFSSKSLNVNPVKKRFQLVGISRRAIPLGVTLPISYASRFNKYFTQRDESGDVLPNEVHKYETYSSVIVRVKSKKHITSFLAYVSKLGFTQKDTNAETVGLVILFVTGILVFISFVIIIIAAINIANTYFMIISERRREIGIMRAIGANRGDIRAIFLSEAALLGFIDGIVGLSFGWLTSRFVDWILWHVVPDFPFKPPTAFAFPLWLVASTIGFGIIFCIFGALWPANHAAAVEPSEALLPQ